MTGKPTMKKNEILKVLCSQGKLALFLFLAECLKNDEGDCIDLEFETHQKGEVATVHKDFSPATYYGEGLYLLLTVAQDTYAYHLLDKYRPYFDNYIGADIFDDDGGDEDGPVRFCFRLSDIVDAMAVNIKQDD